MATFETIVGTVDDDILAAPMEGQRVYGGLGNDTLSSTGNASLLSGDEGDDWLKTAVGGSWNELPVAEATQDGGTGADTMTAEVEAYTQGNASASNDLDAGAGNDTIRASATAHSNGESAFARNVIYAGTGNDAIVSGARANAHSGGMSIENVIYCGDGEDTVDAVAGGQTPGGESGGFDETARNSVFGGSGNDIVTATATANENGSSFAYNELYGDLGDDQLTAIADISANSSYGEATNLLVGGIGDDALKAALFGFDLGSQNVTNMLDGGHGNDTLEAELRFDTSPLHAFNTLLGGDGADRLISRTEVHGSYSLSQDPGILASISRLDGGTGDDILNARTQATTSEDVVAEIENRLTGGDGGDRLSAYTSLALVEYSDAFAEGSRAENVLSGGGGADVLRATIAEREASAAAGSTAAPVTTGWCWRAGRGTGLDGGAGSDAMIGGAGGDTYVVDDAGDTVAETAAPAPDTVLSSITFTLGANLEDLRLTGTAVIHGTGNALANRLYGNGAANVLRGGFGDDVLNGSGGDDTLYANTGNDTLLGSAGDDTLYGSGGNDSLFGGGGNDTLSGGIGTDSMNGGAGNDVYVIGDATDIATETLTGAAGGADSVIAALAYVLSANVERLTLSGTAAINGSGNDANNRIVGNSAANMVSGFLGRDTLAGLDGADRLIGGAAADVLIGGLGDDRFDFNSALHSTAVGRDAIRAGNGALAFQGAGTVGGDRIDLATIDANESLAGDQRFVFGGTGTGYVSLANSGPHTLVRANTDADAAFEFELRIEDGDVAAIDYDAADFIL